VDKVFRPGPAQHLQRDLQSVDVTVRIAENSDPHRRMLAIVIDS
jgi:hypothetical protein